MVDDLGTNLLVRFRQVNPKAAKSWLKVEG
jgi:hypothetical protein